MKPYYQDGKHGITLYHGDCREVLPSLTGLHACVTDPPYGLRFMGKRWDYDVPSKETWEAVLRSILPGAHLLAFAGTRTQHRMAVNIEDAGFEIRDMIQWLYGSGFPKSLDIGKAIDKAAGAEREVVGTWKPTGTARPKADGSGGYRSKTGGLGSHDEALDGTLPITAPATDAAKQWDGWGTALKPACEPITVARKPLSEGTVAANVLKHGTGGINVDGCRVGTETVGWGAGGTKLYEGGLSREGVVARPVQGRWPANVILTHAPGCVCAGTKRVKGGSGWSQSGSKESENLAMSGKNYTRPPKPDAFADADGLETVEAWECVEGCPVKLLDEQSGDCSSPWIGNPNVGAKGGLMFGGSSQAVTGKPEYRDTGGASRFFYTPKASRTDRGEGNTHPTVKPTKLMQYLCRLVTPPGGIVLDPFAGSGTTLVAARMEHLRAIGIELDERSCEIAARRLDTTTTGLFPA